MSDHRFNESGLNLIDSSAFGLAVSAALPDVVVVLDQAGVVQHVSASTYHILDLSPSELIGRSALDILHPEDVPLTAERIQDVLSRRVYLPPVEVRARHGSREWVPVEVRANPIVVDGSVVGMAAILREISMRKDAQELIARMAYHDDLTDLPNRRYALDRLGHMLGRTESTTRSVSLLFIDLDGFKKVNDTCGHLYGDLVLREMAARILHCMRSSDTVARMGGDEFIVLLEGLALSDVQQVAERIIQAVDHPCTVGEHTVRVTASVGISVCPSVPTTVRDIMARVDAAMYRAKESGKNCYVVDEESIAAASAWPALPFADREAGSLGDTE